MMHRSGSFNLCNDGLVLRIYPALFEFILQLLEVGGILHKRVTHQICTLGYKIQRGLVGGSQRVQFQLKAGKVDALVWFEFDSFCSSVSDAQKSTLPFHLLDLGVKVSIVVGHLLTPFQGGVHLGNVQGGPDFPMEVVRLLERKMKLVARLECVFARDRIQTQFGAREVHQNRAMMRAGFAQSFNHGFPLLRPFVSAVQTHTVHSRLEQTL